MKVIASLSGADGEERKSFSKIDAFKAGFKQFSSAMNLVQPWMPPTRHNKLKTDIWTFLKLWKNFPKKRMVKNGSCLFNRW